MKIKEHFVLFLSHNWFDILHSFWCCYMCLACYTVPQFNKIEDRMVNSIKVVNALKWLSNESKNVWVVLSQVNSKMVDTDLLFQPNPNYRHTVVSE